MLRQLRNPLLVGCLCLALVVLACDESRVRWATPTGATRVVMATPTLSALLPVATRTAPLSQPMETPPLPNSIPMSPAVSPTPAAPQPTATPPLPTAIPTSPTPAPTQLRVIAKGFGQRQQEVGFAFIIENPNPKLAVEQAVYLVTAYDGAGQILKVGSDLIPALSPGQRSGVASRLRLPPDTRTARLDVQILPGTSLSSEPLAPFVSDRVAVRGGREAARVVGMIRNPLRHDVSHVSIAAVAYDAAGAIIGGGQAVIASIRAGELKSVEVPITTSGSISEVELYAGVRSFARPR